MSQGDLHTGELPASTTTPVDVAARPWRRSRQSDDARASELLELERQLTRAEHRLLAETLVGVMVCCAVGLFLVGWALHTTDGTLGAIAFWSGLLLGDLGMFGLLLRHYHKSETVGL